MKEYAGVELYLLVLLNTYCMQVNTVVRFTPRSHYLYGKNPPVPIGWVMGGGGGLMTWSGGSGEERNLVPSPMMEALGPGHIVCADH
jgi:hypothetical protein